MYRNLFKLGHKFKIDESYVKWGEWWNAWSNNTWESETFDIFDRFIRKNTNYIDIGAWIGPTVLYVSQIANKCYALEPDPLAYKQLCENIKINFIDNVQLFNEAIIDYDGELTLGNGSLGDSMTRISESANAFKVPCKTLETFVNKYSIQDPIFIKMDIEGAEEFALKTIDFFQKRKPTIYISLHPFWFKDEKEGMKTINEVGKLYKYQYDIKDGGSFVFTDTSL